MLNIPRGDHFARSLTTSEFVLPFIEQAVSEVCVAVPEFKSQCDVFLHRRRNAVVNRRPMLRPYLARSLYELGGGNDWKGIAPALAAVELHNISTYQTNLSFDGKLDWPHAKTSSHNQVMAAMTSISAAHALLERTRLAGASSHAIARSCWRFHEANAAVYMGQYLDLNVLTAHSQDDVAEWDDAEFFRVYLQRCGLMGGGTFTSGLIGLYLSPSGNDEALEAILREYLRLLGLGTQLTNDLGDYCPDESRPYSANFVDLRRGRLTLPTYRLLREGFQPAVRILESPDEEAEQACIACSERLRDTNLYGEARRLLELEVWAGISHALKQLRKHGRSDHALSPLTFARPFLFNTKYLKYFRRDTSVGA